MKADNDNSDRDREHWDAVDEACELLLEERYEDGLRALRDVIKADPQNPYAYHYAGVAMAELKQIEPARDAFRAALRYAPNYLAARVALSHVLRELGDARGALIEAEDALARFPRDAEAMRAAGLAHAALGQRKAAKRRLEGYLGSSPELEQQLEVQQVLEMLGIGEEGDPIEFS
ncbi:MAG: tetratricopeptide repeat protein [Polyangiaceae bacterium]|nr:tetratricopeptide repeat protein [Polyangiaceae bacterium]